jgi:hypothetical protein
MLLIHMIKQIEGVQPGGGSNCKKPIGVAQIRHSNLIKLWSEGNEQNWVIFRGFFF